VVQIRDDAGWRGMASATTATLLSVWGSQESGLFAAGGDDLSGAILRLSEDAWIVEQELSTPVLGVFGAPGAGVFAVGGSGLALRRDGTGWTFEGAEASFELRVRKRLGKFKPFFQMERFTVIEELPSQTGRVNASALIAVAVDGVKKVTAAEGNGPINALNKALREALEGFYPSLKSVHLTDYKVRVLNPEGGTAARVRVWLESTDGPRTWSTVGVSTDVIEASCLALMDSIEYKLIKDLEGKYQAFL